MRAPYRTAEQRRALPSPPDHAFVRPSCRPSMGQPSPADHPSNPKSVRPTDRPVLPRCKTSIVLTATMFTLFTTTTKLAAFGRHHKRGGAAFGRATSFVASFVEVTRPEAVNIPNIVAVNTVLVLHLSQPGGLLAGRAVDRIYGGSDGHASDWLF